MAPAEIMNIQSLVERVAGLPLISSTYTLMSSMYSSTKDNHPYIRTVCEAAEQGVRTVTSVALTTASPIIGKLEPQITIANDLACKGLDTIERRLSILHQPSDQIVSQAKDVVKGTVSTVTGTVSGTLTNVVEKTRGAVHDGMEKTKSVVSGGVGSVLESRVVRVVNSGVNSALSTSEDLVEQYLPESEDQQELESDAVGGFDNTDPSYYVRLGSLSTKVRTRVYSRARASISEGRRRSIDFISSVDLAGYGRRNVHEANQLVNNKINSIMRWKSFSVPNQENRHAAEVIESRTLTLAGSLTHKLQTTCSVLVSSLQAIPSHIQQEALSLSRSVSQAYSSFSKATLLEQLPTAMVASGRSHLGKVKNSLDHVLDYLINNTPLNWLIGPFYPRMPLDGARTSAASCTQCSCSQLHQGGRADVEMESLQAHQEQQ